MKITVVATGKIGLPLAVQYASEGHEVIGVDLNANLVDSINRGVEPFPGEAGLAEMLAEQVAAGRLRATTDYAEAIPNAEAIVIVVPLLVDEEHGKPDFAWMDAATRSFAELLRPGTLVSYETTLPVGTTRGRWKPMIEEISGLREGEDFHLVFSPERVFSGRIFADLRKYPKLVGALNQAGAERAIAFYESVLAFDERDDLSQANGVWDMGSAEAAELAKLAETTYRDVNIGLANQFARFADTADIDIYKVIEACNTQPFSHIHRPGIAVGGHCIPVYPKLYLSTDPEASIVRTAREYNESMPEYVVGRVEQMMGALTGVKVAVLGAAYRGGVKETAVSGVFPLVAALIARGAEVTVHDPLFADDELARFGFVAHELGQPADVVILQTDHAMYREIGPNEFPGVKLLADGRNITDPAVWKGVPRFAVGA
ncbi:nucleotide sugar dehydrogenase [Leucobacter sp. UT-8R-CII-1-4]|uniref:nucleotide sugar dehydrogenase n=1 Tax=Leucobacter sp. UT-8R-CII-1-4 TaxID=3040075 RepID=UPI0024A94A6F|nr:nucleotide sugar dehydrogenase [Leucobacter sp. UT-8R-CII-1-4]MDI6023756.1 nucleotide sugar dehydrogenase [Leucobacter sp. UT-8R-CII-1-4]